MPRDPTGASRQRQLLRISQKLAHTEPETALGVLQRCEQTPDVMLRTAAILLSEARSDGWLRAARRILRVATRTPPADQPRSVKPRKRALELLALLLAQRPSTQRRADALLRAAAFELRLSAAILCYPRAGARRRPGAPPPGYSLRAPPAGVRAIDGALPSGLLRNLQRAFAADGPFWREHKYACGESPFFSYVMPLDGAPQCGLDRVVRAVHARVCAAFPAAKAARYAEWWAHCRPHSAGHQLHFDSDDEGRGGVRNPIVSTALYLTSGAGGPTLVTEQRVSDGALATHGWTVFPRANRLVMFDGRLLHGVIPGRGVAPAGGAARRITLMIAFWPHIRQRSDARPAAARPFPYEAANGGGGAGLKWPTRMEWAAARDGEVAAAAAEDDAPRLLWRVEPVWQALGGEGAAAMPAYERCFQGF